MMNDESGKSGIVEQLAISLWRYRCEPKQQTTLAAGIILPYLAVTVVALCGFVALAIDLGMVMVAKTQTQNAADAAAFAGARTLTGGTSANTTQATTNGQAVAAANVVLGQSIPAANVTMTLGPTITTPRRRLSIRNIRRYRRTTTIWRKA